MCFIIVLIMHIKKTTSVNIIGSTINIVAQFTPYSERVAWTTPYCFTHITTKPIIDTITLKIIPITIIGPITAAVTAKAASIPKNAPIPPISPPALTPPPAALAPVDSVALAGVESFFCFTRKFSAFCSLLILASRLFRSSSVSFEYFDQ